MTVGGIFRQASRWIQGKYSERRNGRECFCMIGALSHVYHGEEYDAANKRVKAAIKKLWPGDYSCGRFIGIAQWNDVYGRTIADIRSVVRLARV